MDRVFNMGLGMVMVVAPWSADAVLARLKKAKSPGRIVGEIRKGSGVVRYE